MLWTIYLNGGFRGGETEFLYQNRRIAPKTGSLLIAPTAFTHTHRGNMPKGEDKYIATSWILLQPRRAAVCESEVKVRRMADAEIDVLPLLRQLLVFARKWSHGIPLDFDTVAQVRRRVLTSNHRHHVREIPIYAQLAREGDITDRDPCELTRNRLVLSDDWFRAMIRNGSTVTLRR